MTQTSPFSNTSNIYWCKNQCFRPPMRSMSMNFPCLNRASTMSRLLWAINRRSTPAGPRKILMAVHWSLCAIRIVSWRPLAPYLWISAVPSFEKLTRKRKPNIMILLEHCGRTAVPCWLPQFALRASTFSARDRQRESWRERAGLSLAVCDVQCLKA